MIAQLHKDYINDMFTVLNTPSLTAHEISKLAVACYAKHELQLRAAYDDLGVVIPRNKDAITYRI